MDNAVAEQLKAIRDQIDTIDEQLHRLLIDRSRVIAELIRKKGVGKPGGAFRPDREADMMRRLVMRHEGPLPLGTIEHILREVISTFTAVQAPYGVVAGPASDPFAMRDLARFYFGFSVPVTSAASSEAAVARVADTEADIAVVAVDAAGRWWDRLLPPAGPKIFAKLPFIEAPGRPADLPAYVVGPPLKERPVADILVYAVDSGSPAEAAIDALSGTIVSRADGATLFEAPVATSGEELPAGAALVGSFSQPIRYVAARTS
jgi:chorismate mutase